MKQRSHADYYNTDYFNWQKNIGVFAGKFKSFIFQKPIKKTDTIIDFGCGGGFLLKNLKCARKIGIEPNKNAHHQLKLNNVEAFSSPHELLEKYGENFADVIISNNALEHSLNPLIELKSLYPLLKKGGLIYFIVPCDNINLKYYPNNINYHLYSWSPLNLGNLFNEAGFKVFKTNSRIEKWPPYYKTIQKIFGWKLFFLICKVYALFDRSWFESEIQAYK